jgi:hypothetical protein
MNTPIAHRDFDIAEIDAVLEAEKAARKAPGRKRWTLFLSSASARSSPDSSSSFPTPEPPTPPLKYPTRKRIPKS